MRAGAALAAVLLLVGSAAAQERRNERPWSVELGATHVALGDRHPTGGWTPTIAARRWWPASERGRVSVGLAVAAFDFSSFRWLGVLAGPELGADYRISESWRVGGGLALDAGRIPVCNDWHLCLRYWGLFPRAQAGLTYEPAPGASMSFGLGARYVNTLAWEGISWEPTASARFGW
ncbi:hypothetical protein WME98_49890 [Sorangium sp. So ce296]|uniref:hypothetical protein n=1 Tax=Sorangium sp. So ce296 TaxID=3133296 RepID=UPI003F5F5CB8